MNTFKQAAIEVLCKIKKPLSAREITRSALESGILETNGATPELSMNAQIIMDIKHKGAQSDFRKTGPSTYTLNTRKKTISKNVKVEEKEQIEEEKIAIESGYTGKAGEHLVCSELLFREFNASIMSVDVGVDIIAIKNNQMYGIQVKTSNLNKFNTYVFDVRKVSFKRHNLGNIFYVFVLHENKKSQFLILPLSEMERKVNEKAILEVGHGKRYRVNIKFRKDTVYLGNESHDMKYYLNNWDVIK